MADPSGIFEELKRRRVFRATAAYVVVAAGVVALASDAFPALGLPAWTVTFVVVLAALGLPVTIALSWAFDVRPSDPKEGEPGSRPVTRPAKPDAGSEGARPRWTPGRIAGVGAVVILALAGAAMLLAGGDGGAAGSRAPIRSLAVLPLDNLTGDDAQAYFVDGMHDALIAELGRLEQLTVLSRTSTLRYRDTELSMGEIARELGVEGLIEGSVFRAGDSVRITVQLVRGSPEEHLWTDSYRGDLSHALSLQSRVARSIADAVRLTLTPEQQTRLAGGGAVDPRAQDAYLQGRALWRTRLLPDLERAVRLMEEAVALDSTFALGWAGLADAHLVNAVYSSQVSVWNRSRLLAMYGRSREAARRALDLDSNLPGAYATLGYVDMLADLDWEEAERQIRKSLELNPNSAQAWNWLSDVLGSQGRTGEAVRAGEKAVELDPFSPLMHRDLGDVLAADDRCEDAVLSYERALELDPNHVYAYLGLGDCSIRMGSVQEGVEYLLAAAQQLSPAGDRLTGDLREAFESDGWAGWARRVLEPDTPFSGLYRVWAYAVLGQLDEAVATLRAAFENRDPSVILAGRPYWDDFPELRAHPGFQALMREVGLAD